MLESATPKPILCLMQFFPGSVQMMDDSQTLLSTEKLKEKFELEGQNIYVACTFANLLILVLM